MWQIVVAVVGTIVLLVGLSFRLKSWHESGTGGAQQTAAGPA